MEINSAPQKIKWSVLATVLTAMIAIAFAFLTVYTYYRELSQYQTADQTLTFDRIQSFLSAPNKYDVAMGTNFSNLAIGKAGDWLATILEPRYGPDKLLFFGVNFNHVVPFSLAQVTLALFLIAACIVLSGKVIGWHPKKDWLYFVLLFDLVANLPILKGVAKVLKYDIFSILLTALALLSFIVFKQKSQKWYLFLAAFFSALSFVEKEVSFLTGGFILAYEAISLAYSSIPIRDFFKKICNFYLLFVLTFIFTVYACVPRFWHSPGDTFSIITRLSMYLGQKELTILGICGVVSIVLIYMLRKTVKNYLSHNSKKILYAFCISMTLFLVFSLFYQSNNMHVLNTQKMIDYVNANNIFVGKEVVGQRITTLDGSFIITAVMIFLNEIRIIIYMTPEIFVLGLLLIPILVARKKNIFQGSEAMTLLGIFSSYSIFFMFIAAVTISPVESKYLGSCLFLLAITVGLTACQFIKEANLRSWKLGLVATIILLAAIAKPSFSAGPAYFSYMSSFRDTKYEDVQKFSLSDDSFWTWVGWGETSYSSVKYLEKEKIHATVGFDYLPPFYQARDLRYVNIFEPIIGCYTEDQISSTLMGWKEEKGVQYIVISKNMANRHFAPNYIIKKHRADAIYVDWVNGVEYGWLFNIDDLLK